MSILANKEPEEDGLIKQSRMHTFGKICFFKKNWILKVNVVYYLGNKFKSLKQRSQINRHLTFPPPLSLPSPPHIPKEANTTVYDIVSQNELVSLPCDR